MEVTESSLAAVLENFPVAILTTGVGGSAIGALADAGLTAKALYTALQRAEVLRGDGSFTRDHLVREAEDGVLVTRQALAGALHRVPQPEGSYHPWWPYSQNLLLSILANERCESCGRADNGGGYPCDCPVPCGARYCQHPVPGGNGSRDDVAAGSPAVPSHAEEAVEALRASVWQRQQWGEGGSKDDLRSARWELERAKVHALLALDETLTALPAGLSLGGIRDDLAEISHAIRSHGQ